MILRRFLHCWYHDGHPRKRKCCSFRIRQSSTFAYTERLRGTVDTALRRPEDIVYDPRSWYDSFGTCTLHNISNFRRCTPDGCRTAPPDRHSSHICLFASLHDKSKGTGSDLWHMSLIQFYSLTSGGNIRQFLYERVYTIERRKTEENNRMKNENGILKKVLKRVIMPKLNYIVS